MTSHLRKPGCRSRCRRDAVRRAFTIVEMLVVLAIMGMLAAMALVAMGPLSDRRAVNDGAALLQAWLNTARQRAIRDKVPSGLRFLPGNSLPTQSTTATGANYNAFYVTRMAYLEGGTEIVGTLFGGPGSGNSTSFTTTAITTASATAATGQRVITAPTINAVVGGVITGTGIPTGTTISSVTATTITISANLTADLTAGLPIVYQVSLPPTPAFTSTSNDTLIVNEGLPHPITSAGGSAVAISYAWPYAISKTSPAPFRIVRGPSIVTSAVDGDNILTMPRGSCVNFDPATTLTLSNGSQMYPNGIDLGNSPVTGNANLNYIPKSSFTTANGLDIMFSPEGTVLSPASNYPIVFWVGGTGAVVNSSGTVILEAMRGQPQLIAVYPKTGQVVGYTVGIDVTTSNKANAMKEVL